MKTQTLILEARKDEDFGGVGLVPPGVTQDGYNPNVTGLSLAHDILEHVNGFGEIGGIDDELEALGAIWFIRGQFSDLSRDGSGSRYSPEENLASDVTRMFRDHYCGQYVNDNAPRTLALDEADDAFREIVAKAKQDAPGELNDDATPQEIADKWAPYARVALARMRIGYRKAKRKYGSARLVNRLFWDIAEASERYCKHAEEGMQYTLTYGIDRHGHPFASCEEYYGEDFYDEEAA